MADSVSKTNIPVLRSPYGSEVPPKVPVCETDDVGSKVNPVYVKDKVVKASDANVGDVQQPVYMKNGNITAGDVLAPVKAPHIFRDPDGGSMTSDVPTSSTPQDNDPDTMIATKKYVDDKRTIVEVSPKTVEGDLICEITVDGTLYKIYNGGGKGNAFVVTFKDWDATTLKEEPVLKGGNATPPTTPTRTGYTFSSWSGNYTNVQKDETVTATYTINKYTVTFNLNGGNIGGDTSNVVISNVEHGTTIGSIRPTDPTRTQTAQYTYTFNGWNKADTTAVTGNTTVTAQWTETTRYYDIIWKNNGGSQLRKDNLAYGSTPSYGSTPEAENKETGKVYTFTGWSPEVSTVTGPATYTAQYSTSATTFSVYFNPNGGKINNSTSTYEKTGVAYNTTLANVPPPTATRDSTSSASYTFKGWGESSSATTPVDASTKVLTGSKTFYALWTETPITAKYTVTFNPDGGKINGSTANVVKPDIESGTLVSAIPPPADSTMSRDKTAQYTYSFNGWSKTSGGTKITPGSTSVTSSFTLYALWNRTTNSYAIQFFNSTKANVKTSTSLYGPNNVSYGSTPTYGGTATTSLQPTDAESGKTYTFTGWKRTSDSGIGIKSVTGAENYYAQYSSETTTYTVKYYPNNGTLDGSTSVQTKSDVAHGSGVYATGNFTKARTGYTFAGWATSSTGSAIAESSVIPTAGKEFYAVWTINSWTVTVNRVNTSGGTAPTSTATKVSGAGTYNYGAAVTTSGSVESGYTNNWVFKGMECASGGVTTPTSFNMPNNNVVINAKFAPKFLVRFYYKTDGSAIKIDSGDQYIEYKTAATAPTKPTVTGWTAGNWDKTFTSITAATDVTCQYTINSHTLTITRRNTVSGGTAPTATETTITGDGKKNYGTVVTPTASVNSSYTNNWVFKNFKDSSGSVITSVTMPDSDVTIYADFTPKYAVSFYKIVDGVKTQVGTTQYVEHGGNATAPTKPTVDGHTAGDWKGTYTNVTSNQEVTCTYTINTHTVTFSYYNGTSAKTDVRTVNWGTTYSGISKPTDTTRTGYNFTGWGDPTPSSAINSSGQVIGNCVVNGLYEQSEFTVYFYDKNGTQLAKYEKVQKNTKLSTLAQFSDVPTWSGHRFRSWGDYDDTKYRWNFDVSGDTAVVRNLYLYPDYWIDWNFHGAESPATPVYSDDPTVVYRLSRSYFTESHTKYSFSDEESTVFSKMQSSIPTQAGSAWVSEKWSMIDIERSDGVLFADDGVEITSGGGYLLMYDNEDFYCRYVGKLDCKITLETATASDFRAYTNHKVQSGQKAIMFNCDGVTFTHNATPTTHKMKMQLLDGSQVLYESIDITSYNGSSETTLPNSDHPDWVPSGNWITTLGNKLAFYESKYSGCTATWNVSVTMYVEIGPTIRTGPGNVDWDSSHLFGSLNVGSKLFGIDITGMIKPELEVIARDTTNRTITVMPTHALSSSTDGSAITRNCRDTKSSSFSWGENSSETLRYYLNNDFLSLIQTTTFKNRLVAHRNYYRTGTTPSDLHYTDDKVWVPDVYEVGGVATSVVPALTADDGVPVFSKFASIGNNAANDLRTYTGYNNAPIHYWLRTISGYGGTSSCLYSVIKGGGINGGSWGSTKLFGILPCFTIALE